MLAAAPDHAGRSWIGLAFLIVPVLAGYLIARPVAKTLPTRSERLLAAGLAAALTGALVAAVAAIARGGIGDGRWSTIGAPPLLVGGVVAAEVGIVALGYAGLAGGRGVPWQPARAKGGTPSRAPADLAAGQAGADIENDLLPPVTVVDQTPADDPTAGEAPDDDALVDDALADGPQTDEVLVDGALVDGARLDEALAEEAPAHDSTDRPI